MTGRVAREGFAFSDLLLMERVLRHLVSRRTALIEGAPLPPSPLLRVESDTQVEGSPEWDLQEEPATPGDPLVLEEVKGSLVGAADRRALWIRIRKSVAGLDRAGQRPVRPRLTINCDSPPEHPERWRALARLARTVRLAEKPPQFRSDEALAQEALFYLTRAQETDGEEPGPALSEARAREVLSRFELHELVGKRTLESRVEELIGQLSLGIGLEQLRNALLGEVTRRAASTNRELHAFYAEDLLGTLTVLERLSVVPQEGARLWQKLRRLDAQARGWAATGSDALALPYQDWRAVQPAVAEVADSLVASQLALTGKGGQGKSVLVGKLADESRAQGRRVLHVAGSDLRGERPETLAQALELGRFLSVAEGVVLHLYVDGLESASEDREQLRDLLGALGGTPLKGGARTVVTARTQVWLGLAGAQDDVPGWRRIELAEWDEGLVQRLAASSQRPGLASDLQALLRTPFFLDLFLRTFSPAKSVPASVHTRHAILSAYWAQRVLPPEHPDSAARLEVLLRFAEEEAHGVENHRDGGAALPELAKEGVLVGRQGVFRFRHPLLRDFAFLQWVLRSGSDAQAVVRGLADVANGFALWGTIRALLEASASSDASDTPQGLAVPAPSQLGRALSASAPRLLLAFADVLGELAHPSGWAPDEVANALPSPSQAADFIERMLESARLTANVGWLRWLSALPDSAAWAERTGWVRAAFLAQAQLLLDTAWESASPEERASIRDVARAVAIRLREWSCAQRLQEELGGRDGRLVAQLMRTIARHAPGMRTLQWFRAEVHRSWYTRWNALHSLRPLVNGAQERGEPLDPSSLVEFYLEAAELAWRDGVVVHSGAGPPSPEVDYERTNIALLGHDSRGADGPGLLDSLPEHFLPLALGRLAAPALARFELELESSAKTSTHERSAPFKPLVPTNEPEPVALEERLARGEAPSLPVADVIGSLVDDGEGGYLTAGEDERGHLAEAIEQRLARAVEEQDGDYLRLYWRAAEASRSATAWRVLLEQLMGEDPVHVELVDEILRRPPLYHLRSAQAAMHRAIARRWSHADTALRQTILARIAEVQRSPVVHGRYAVGRLLSAVPPEDRPSELAEFLHLYALRGWDPRPVDLREEADGWLEETENETPGEVQGGAASPWGAVKDAVGRLPGMDAAGFAHALEVLQRAISAGFPSPQEMRADSLSLVAVREHLVALAQKQATPSGANIPTLPSEQVGQIAAWAFDVVRSFSAEELNADMRPMPLDAWQGPEAIAPWARAIQLLDVALRPPYLADEPARHVELLRELARVTQPPSPSLARTLFASLHPWHWFRKGSEGRALLWQLLSEKVNDPGALSAAGGALLRHLSLGELEALARRWLEDWGALPANEESRKFVIVLGHLLGSAALFRERGERSGLSRLLEAYLVRAPTDGPLSDASTYGAWVERLAAGARKGVLSQHPTEQLLLDYATLVSACWPHARNAPVRGLSAQFVRWVFDVPEKLAGKFPELLTQTLWPQMRPLACTVIRDGTAAHVRPLVYLLRGSPLLALLGAENLHPVLEALYERVMRVQGSPAAVVGEAERWDEVFLDAPELLVNVGRLESTSASSKEQLHRWLQDWAGARVPGAVGAARRVREP